MALLYYVLSCSLCFLDMKTEFAVLAARGRRSFFVVRAPNHRALMLPTTKRREAMKLASVCSEIGYVSGCYLQLTPMIATAFYYYGTLNTERRKRNSGDDKHTARQCHFAATTHERTSNEKTREDRWCKPYAPEPAHNSESQRALISISEFESIEPN